MNAGAFRWATASRVSQTRFLGEPERVSRVLETRGRDRHAKPRRSSASSTFAPDDIDWDDEIRIAFEERASSRPTR